MGKEMSARFNMVLTPEERSLIEDAARNNGATLSGFVRQAAMREAERVERQERALKRARTLLRMQGRDDLAEQF